MNLGRQSAIVCLRLYKLLVSPMLQFIAGPFGGCRYTPTCSEYAMEAIERFGVFRGGLKAAARLLRCHPFAHGGYDPVVAGQFLACPEQSEGTHDQQLTTTYHGAL
jgi:putative membrane protein insertion efficiency factor